jgi:hypothetical protein
MKPLILVGMNPRTRHLISWDSDAEIWTLNEAYINKWMKRYDVLFQLHPRWDWERNNNMADPNHPRYIKAQSGDCLFCSGTGKAMKEGAEVDCPHCDKGHYEVPEHRYSEDVEEHIETDDTGAIITLRRAAKTIVMQDDNKDVPGCLSLAVNQMTEKYCMDGKPYFTSTFAHMLICAFWMGYTDISIYGFEMESETEYAHQRACAEYWIGYGRALGVKIEAPGSKILTGTHYAYETNEQAYQTRLELRINHLKDQLQKAEAEAIKSEGALNAITPFKGIPEVTPAFDLYFDEHFRRKGFVSFLRGTIRELENASKIHQALHADGSEKPSDAIQFLGLTYELG